MKKKPCDDCPWRKNALPGWLGPHDNQYFQDVYNSDYPYPCHKTLETPDEHICIGLVHTRNNSCKRAKLEGELSKAEKELKGHNNNCFDNLRQFVQYHNQFKKED